MSITDLTKNDKKTERGASESETGIQEQKIDYAKK